MVYLLFILHFPVTSSDYLKKNQKVFCKDSCTYSTTAVKIISFSFYNRITNYSVSVGLQYMLQT